MLLKLKEYQEKAVKELTNSVSKLLTINGVDKTCVFQSPTGSGKTVMVAKFIEEIIKELPETDLCFLWVSIGKGELHEQSMKSLDKIFDGFPNVNLLEEKYYGTRSAIEQNDIVVVNWEKLYSKYSSGDKKGEWKNKLMRDGDFVNFIDIIESTKEKRKIIMIIDESHYASSAERIIELRGVIKADITLEMSATPKILGEQLSLLRTMKSPVRFNNDESVFIYIKPESVIEEGMIKKEIIINESIDSIIDDERTSQDLILEAAFKKRLELKESYERAGSRINPLCIIQLPNAEAGDSKREAIELFLENKGVTESNRKLAIWLSEKKSDTLNEISEHENEVEFLIFKQAIDTGWDCPRAHILVKLRDIKSFTFEVQTVGRILRMPELRHYEDENLNTGFIFTNLQGITVLREEYNPNIIKHLKSARKQSYQALYLKSYYKSRADYGDITYSFGKILEAVFCKEFGIETNPLIMNTTENVEKLEKKGLTTSVKVYKENILVDKKIEGSNYDTIDGNLHDSDDRTLLAKLADNDLQDLFNSVINENLNGFAPKRSIPIVRGAIYQWFKKYIDINYHYPNGVIHIQHIFLHHDNKDTFSKLVSKATGEYKPIKKMEVKSKIQETYYDWDVKREEYFNQYTDEKMDYRYCIYEPCYLEKDRSKPEIEFEKHLEEKGELIDWWYKNGKEKKDYFGVRYLLNEMPQTFYPDYIIQLKSGKVFIGDTKAGQTAENAGLRANALQDYIREQNESGKDLVGGIIVLDASKQWRVNQRSEYIYDKNDLSMWDYFDEIIRNHQ